MVRDGRGARARAPEGSMLDTSVFVFRFSARRASGEVGDDEACLYHIHDRSTQAAPPPRRSSPQCCLPLALLRLQPCPCSIQLLRYHGRDANDGQSARAARRRETWRSPATGPHWRLRLRVLNKPLLSSQNAKREMCFLPCCLALQWRQWRLGGSTMHVAKRGEVGVRRSPCLVEALATVRVAALLSANNRTWPLASWSACTISRAELFQKRQNHICMSLDETA